jgi:flagellar assembly factor FliW
MDTMAANAERTIQTSQFGELTFGQDHIFTFDEGVLGFEDLRGFVLISDEATDPFKWLISVEKPEIGFPLLSPWHLDVKYNPGKSFDLEKEVLLVVITLENNDGVMTANMKAPIVLNVETQAGRQVILPSERYTPTFIIPKK